MPNDQQDANHNAATVTIETDNYASKVVTALNEDGSTHTSYLDEPKALGGQDQGPTPVQLLAAALGGCKTITGKMYADRKGWTLTRLEVHVTIDRGDIIDGKLQTRFTSKIKLEGDLDQEQRERLKTIIDRCPVHRILTGDVEAESLFVDQ